MAHRLKRSQYLVPSDRLSIAQTTGQWRVVFSTRSGSILTLSETVWELIERGDFDRLPRSSREQLVSARVLVPDEEDELATIVQENLEAIDAHPVLYEVIQPTAWCQLACGYCGQAHAGQQLSAGDQEALLERLGRRLASGRYTHLKIGWFGAEPLAALHVLRRLSPRLQALAREHRCGYSARIVTNGLALTPAVADELVSLGISEAEITLDGVGVTHDTRRPTKTGLGTYARIFDHVRTAADTAGLKVVVRCNVDRHNVDAVDALANALADAGLAERVSFYASPVYSWGNDAQAESLQPGAYAEQEIEWLAHQMRLGFTVGLVPPRRKIVCMSVQREAEVVDAYGTTFNCTEVPYVPAYGEPNVYALTFHGRGADDEARPSATAPLALRHFNEAVLNGTQSACADCRMLPVCGGHCPKAWQEGHPPCPPAKYNMPERLNLLFALQQPHA